MIHSILLENFLAHKKTEVRFGPGMTVLTGANNCGKSAVVEGLRCVSQNPAPRHFIRHGAKEARVTVTVDDGTRIAWVRKKATVVYEVLRPGDLEPEVYRKLRPGQVPDEVLDLLRLDQVELESGSPKQVDVHIGNQRSPIFLLGDNSADARMAEFFAASTEGAHLISMQKLLKRKMRDNASASSALRRTMDRLETDLDRLAPLPDIELELASAGEMRQALERSDSALPRLEGIIAETRRTGEALSRLTGRDRVLAGLAAPPELFDAPALERAALGLTTLSARIERGQARLGALTQLAEPPQPQPTAGIVDTVQSLNRLTSQINAHAKKKTILADLQEPPMLFDEQPLAGLAGEIGMVRSRLDQLGKVRSALEAKLATLETDIRQRTEEIGNCPLCHAKLDPDALIGGGA